MLKITDLIQLATILGLSWVVVMKPNNPIQVPSSNVDSPSCKPINQNVVIVPFSGKSMGAEVFGFEPQQAIDDDNLALVIQQALEKHLVLVFHNVSDKLTPQMHVQLAKSMGPVDPVISSAPSYLQKGVFNSPDQVKRALDRGGKLEDLGATMLKAAQLAGFPREITRIVKEPSDLIAFGEGWHSDLTYRPAPPFAAVLVSRQLPSIGGNTHFSDMRVAYDLLSQEVKEKIESLRANHTDGFDIFSSHPVVRHDNKYGRSSLFVNKAFTRHLVWGPQDEVDDALLNSLLQHVEDLPTNAPHAFLDISWSPGQIVMWDNRFTQHAAHADYNERREMHRTIISGTVPF